MASDISQSRGAVGRMESRISGDTEGTPHLRKDKHSHGFPLQTLGRAFLCAPMRNSLYHVQWSTTHSPWPCCPNESSSRTHLCFSIIDMTPPPNLPPPHIGPIDCHVPRLPDRHRQRENTTLPSGVEGSQKGVTTFLFLSVLVLYASR